jgi:hypothetical protein
MSPDFTMSPQTSVTQAVALEKTQLDRIEAKLDKLLEQLSGDIESKT